MAELRSLDDKYMLFDDPLYLFSAMTEDIRRAKKRIFLQTYKFANDIIGQKFRDELTQKAQQGLEILILIDAWGAGVSESFFQKLISFGGKVKFFKKLKYSLDFFAANHRRNHRKLLLIDSELSYIGSTNVTSYCINWRECTLRIRDDITTAFERIFLDDYENVNKLFDNKKKYVYTISHNDLDIIKDVPSERVQPVRDRYMQLISQARHQVIIETPYFLPGMSLRKTMFEAVKRGVKITAVMPQNSDMRLFDILRDNYVGKYYRNRIEIKQYVPHNLHAKIMLVDDSHFVVGSSNFDYRSFRFMHEINIAGSDKQLLQLIREHLQNTLAESRDFDYDKWKKRGLRQKMIEKLLLPFRHLF